jgi:hypothetical protein
MWFHALAKVLPRQRIRRLFCGQAADGFWSGSWFDRAMRHVDRDGLVERGAPLFAIVDELRVGLYVTPATTIAIDGSGELFHTRLKNIDWRRQSDAAIDALFANGQAIAEARLASLLRVCVRAPAKAVVLELRMGPRLHRVGRGILRHDVPGLGFVERQHVRLARVDAGVVQRRRRLAVVR